MCSFSKKCFSFFACMEVQRLNFWPHLYQPKAKKKNRTNASIEKATLSVHLPFSNDWKLNVQVLPLNNTWFMHLFPLVMQSVLMWGNVCGAVWLGGVLKTLSTSQCLMNDCGLIGRCLCQHSLGRPITLLQSSPIFHCYAAENTGVYSTNQTVQDFSLLTSQCLSYLNREWFMKRPGCKVTPCQTWKFNMTTIIFQEYVFFLSQRS